MKGRGCADGKPQHNYIFRLESSVPTVKIHALFLGCLVDAIERRNFVVAGIPGAFLSADWPEDAPDCYIQFEEVIIDMICQINPEYEEYIKFTKKWDRYSNRIQYLVRKVTKGIC